MAAWREGGLDRARALASMQMNLEASLLHSPTSTRSDFESFGAESRAKMARMHIDRLWKDDANHGSRLPHGTRFENMHAYRWMLQEKTISIYTRLKYFNACMSAVVCLGSGHRTLYKKQLYALDVLFRKLCRSINKLHAKPMYSVSRGFVVVQLDQLRPRDSDFQVSEAATTVSKGTVDGTADNSASQHWKSACYIMSLPHERWVRRMLHWQLLGRGLVGRPAMHFQEAVSLSIAEPASINCLALPTACTGAPVRANR